MLVSKQPELFKTMSNRTRAQPHEIYSKLSTHIDHLQSQVLSFNQTTQQFTHKIKQERNRTGSAQPRLKLKDMSQPKYQNLLMHFQLPFGQNIKNQSKIYKKNNALSKNDSLILSSSRKGLGSFIGFKSRTSISQPKNTNKSNKQVQSTMIDNNQSSVSFKANPQAQFSLTQSIVLMPIEQQKTRNRIHTRHSVTPNIQQLINKRQQILNNEWQKTQRYHKKINQFIGENPSNKTMRCLHLGTKLQKVIDKICQSRPQTAITSVSSRVKRMASYK